MPNANNQAIAAQVAAALRRAIPETESVWLFGSRARGDARSDSDFDFLFTVSGDGRLIDYDKRARKALVPLVAEHGVAFDVFSAYVKDMVDPRSQMLKSVVREGSLV